MVIGLIFFYMHLLIIYKYLTENDIKEECR